jgi:hypothetical protein
MGMGIWPALFGILSHQLGVFERPDEYALLFGGITIFPLLPFVLLFSDQGFQVFMVVSVLVVWCLVLIVPALLLGRFRRTRPGREWMPMLILLGLQSAFAFAQAALGAFMLWTKNV